ncbi:hypothetical protein HDU97_001872 [Phlyctochytrium planicorne]|nr:hypothetical protein HDU97_001872 [Phlyctochytrium planicorne]
MEQQEKHRRRPSGGAASALIALWESKATAPPTPAIPATSAIPSHLSRLTTTATSTAFSSTTSSPHHLPTTATNTVKTAPNASSEPDHVAADAHASDLVASIVVDSKITPEDKISIFASSANANSSIPSTTGALAEPPALTSTLLESLPKPIDTATATVTEPLTTRMGDTPTSTTSRTPVTPIVPLQMIIPTRSSSSSGAPLSSSAALSSAIVESLFVPIEDDDIVVSQDVLPPRKSSLAWGFAPGAGVGGAGGGVEGGSGGDPQIQQAPPVATSNGEDKLAPLDMEVRISSHASNPSTNLGTGGIMTATTFEEEIVILDEEEEEEEEDDEDDDDDPFKQGHDDPFKQGHQDPELQQPSTKTLLSTPTLHPSHPSTMPLVDRQVEYDEVYVEEPTPSDIHPLEPTAPPSLVDSKQQNRWFGSSDSDHGIESNPSTAASPAPPNFQDEDSETEQQQELQRRKQQQLEDAADARALALFFQSTAPPQPHEPPLFPPDDPEIDPEDLVDLDLPESSPQAHPLYDLPYYPVVLAPPGLFPSSNDAEDERHGLPTIPVTSAPMDRKNVSSGSRTLRNEEIGRDSLEGVKMMASGVGSFAGSEMNYGEDGDLKAITTTASTTTSIAAITPFNADPSRVALSENSIYYRSNSNGSTDIQNLQNQDVNQLDDEEFIIPSRSSSHPLNLQQLQNQQQQMLQNEYMQMGFVDAMQPPPVPMPLGAPTPVPLMMKSSVSGSGSGLGSENMPSPFIFVPPPPPVMPPPSNNVTTANPAASLTAEIVPPPRSSSVSAGGLVSVLTEEYAMRTNQETPRVSVEEAAWRTWTQSHFDSNIAFLPAGTTLSLSRPKPANHHTDDSHYHQLHHAVSDTSLNQSSSLSWRRSMIVTEPQTDPWNQDDRRNSTTVIKWDPNAPPSAQLPIQTGNMATVFASAVLPVTSPTEANGGKRISEKVKTGIRRLIRVKSAPDLDVNGDEWGDEERKNGDVAPSARVLSPREGGLTQQVDGMDFLVAKEEKVYQEQRAVLRIKPKVAVIDANVALLQSRHDQQQQQPQEYDPWHGVSQVRVVGKMGEVEVVSPTRATFAMPDVRVGGVLPEEEAIPIVVPSGEKMRGRSGSLGKVLGVGAFKKEKEGGKKKRPGLGKNKKGYFSDDEGEEFGPASAGVLASAAEGRMQPMQQKELVFPFDEDEEDKSPYAMQRAVWRPKTRRPSAPELGGGRVAFEAVGMPMPNMSFAGQPQQAQQQQQPTTFAIAPGYGDAAAIVPNSVVMNQQQYIHQTAVVLPNAGVPMMQTANVGSSQGMMPQQGYVQQPLLQQQLQQQHLQLQQHQPTLQPLQPLHIPLTPPTTPSLMYTARQIPDQFQQQQQQQQQPPQTVDMLSNPLTKQTLKDILAKVDLQSPTELEGLPPPPPSAEATAAAVAAIAAANAMAMQAYEEGVAVDIPMRGQSLDIPMRGQSMGLEKSVRIPTRGQSLAIHNKVTVPIEVVMEAMQQGQQTMAMPIQQQSMPVTIPMQQPQVMPVVVQPQQLMNGVTPLTTSGNTLKTPVTPTKTPITPTKATPAMGTPTTPIQAKTPTQRTPSTPNTPIPNPQQLQQQPQQPNQPPPHPFPLVMTNINMGKSTSASGRPISAIDVSPRPRRPSLNSSNNIIMLVPGPGDAPPPPVAAVRMPIVSPIEEPTSSPSLGRRRKMSGGNVNVNLNVGVVGVKARDSVAVNGIDKDGGGFDSPDVRTTEPVNTQE